MPLIKFGPWLPDLGAFGNPGVMVAKNVLPSPLGYLPVPGPSVVTDALAAYPRGAIQARDKDLAVYQYAGDATSLNVNQDGTWTDVTNLSGAYATGSGELWSFAVWQNKVLATNFSDSPQQITMGGANFSDLTTALRSRYIATIRDFVVHANTFDATDGNVPSRVRWSAFNDETDYIVDPSTLSGYQDLKTAPIRALFGGEYGVVFQPNAIWRMQFVGAPTVWQFDEVVPGIGLIGPGAVARLANTFYFLSERGFYALDGGVQARPIGQHKCDRYVLDDLDRSYDHRISAVADPRSNRVWFAYPGAGNSGGRPNKIVVYDVALDRWAAVEVDVELLWAGGGTGYTLEGLDSVSGSLDALPASLDSAAWVGAAGEVAAFNSDFKMTLFTGTALDAQIDTGELQLGYGRKVRLQSFRPIIDGGTVTAQVGTRNQTTSSITWGDVLSQTSRGQFKTRTRARYHSLRALITGTGWEHATGFHMDPRNNDFVITGRR